MKQEDYERVKKYSDLRNIGNYEEAEKYRDCSGVDLSNADISGFNLKGIILDKANLACIDARWSDLEDGSFVGANMYKADLSGANAKNGDFTFIYGKRINLSGANIENAKFPNSDLRHGCIIGAYADGANFDRSLLYYVDFYNTDAMRTEFIHVHAEGIKLDKVKSLYDANFDGANLKRGKVNWRKLIDVVNLDKAHLPIWVRVHFGKQIKGLLRNNNFSKDDDRIKEKSK